MLIAILVCISTWIYTAKNLELRSDFLELLPRDSPGFKAFEHQSGRVAGGAGFLVVVQSPETKENERFIDDLAKKLQAKRSAAKECREKCADDACRARCEPDFISSIEAGTKDLHAFFDREKWLYADLKDLEEADATLDEQIAIRSGLVEDLEAPKSPKEGARPGET